MKIHVRTVLTSAFFLLVVLGPLALSAPLPLGERPKEKANLSGFIGGVDGLAFSPDGQTLASAGGDGTVRLWDSANGKNTATLKHPPQEGSPPWVTAVAFSPDGKTVASSGTHTIKLWDAISGKDTETFLGHSNNLVFSPDGKRLVVTDRRIIWDLQKKKVRPILENANFWRAIAAFGSNGKLLVAGIDGDPQGARSETFSLWDPETGKKTMTFKGHTALVVGLAFSPDCKTMASTGDDYTVKIWDVATGKNLATFKDVPAAWAGMGSPAFSPDGKVLACGYWYQGVDGRKPRRGAIRLYETATGKHLATLVGSDSGPCAHIVFSPDGKLLAAGCAKNTLRSGACQGATRMTCPRRTPRRPVHRRSRDKLFRCPLPCAPRKGLFSKGTPTLCRNGGSSTCRAWHSALTTELWLRPVTRTEPSSCGTLLPARTSPPFPILRFQTRTKISRQLRSAPTAKPWPPGGRDQAIKVWDVATGKCTTLRAEQDMVAVLTFSTDGRTLAASGWGRSGLRLWDLETKKVRILLMKELAGRSLVAFGPKDKLLVADYQNHNWADFSLWDANEGKRLTVFKGHSEIVRQIAISRDGKKVSIRW